MATRECEICGREVDARGYNVHLRKCREVQEKALQEKQDKIMKENEEQEKQDKIMIENEEQEPEPKEDIKKETDTKNPKARNWMKPLAAVLGVLAVGIIGILMLISPKSKESSKKESPTRKPGSRLNR